MKTIRGITDVNGSVMALRIDGEDILVRQIESFKIDSYRLIIRTMSGVNKIIDCLSYEEADKLRNDIYENIFGWYTDGK
jgi:hypothetical protein